LFPDQLNHAINHNHTTNSPQRNTQNTLKLATSPQQTFPQKNRTKMGSHPHFAAEIHGSAIYTSKI
jgi:hypothetical protein